MILSWDSKTIYSRPFSRFYNFNETDISHFTDFITYQKLDGTLSIVWYHPLKQQWFFSTRKSAYATSINNFTGKPFRELMLICMGLDPYTTDNKFTEICNQAGFDPHVTYMFESISPENTIAVSYTHLDVYKRQMIQLLQILEKFTICVSDNLTHFIFLHMVKMNMLKKVSLKRFQQISIRELTYENYNN